MYISIQPELGEGVISVRNSLAGSLEVREYFSFIRIHSEGVLWKTRPKQLGRLVLRAHIIAEMTRSNFLPSWSQNGKLVG